MNFSMHLVVVVAAAYLCRADAAPDEQLARNAQRPTRTFKPGFMAARGFGKRNLPTTRAERSTRSQKHFDPHTSMLVAERFGKRAERENEGTEEERTLKHVFELHVPLMTALDFGKRALESINEERDLDKFWNRLESYQREGLENDDGNEDAQSSSIPSEWFIREMLNNPDFARAVVVKFIDLNQDGMLSTDELLRNVKD